MCESFHDRQAHQISCCQVRNLVAWKTPKNGQNNLDVFSIVNSWDFWWAYIWEKRLPNFIISCHRLKGSNGGCSVPLCVCGGGGESYLQPIPNQHFLHINKPAKSGEFVCVEKPIEISRVHSRRLPGPFFSFLDWHHIHVKVDVVFIQTTKLRRVNSFQNKVAACWGWQRPVWQDETTSRCWSDRPPLPSHPITSQFSCTATSKVNV